jgi:hypothetical protein
VPNARRRSTAAATAKGRLEVTQENLRRERLACFRPRTQQFLLSSPSQRSREAHPNPFTKLDKGKYLHDRPEKDVYKLLIDSFRIRQADDLNFENKTTPGSIYAGASSRIMTFRQYLFKADSPKLLPSWWDAEKQKECEAFGESGAWNDLRKKGRQERGDSTLR